MYFLFTGSIHVCNNCGSTIQPEIIDLETGKYLLPMMSNKSKYFAKFWKSARGHIKPKEFCFSGNYISSVRVNYLKNIKFDLNNEIKVKFSEYFV